MKALKLLRCILLYLALILLLSSCVLRGDDGNQVSDTTDTYAENTQITTDTQASATEKVMCHAEELAKKITLYMPFADICDVLGNDYEKDVEDSRIYIWNVNDKQKIKVVFVCGSFEDDDLKKYRACNVYWSENDYLWTITDETNIDVEMLAKQITDDMLYEDICELLGGEPIILGFGYIHECWHYGENGEIHIWFNSKRNEIVKAYYKTPQEGEVIIKGNP